MEVTNLNNYSTTLSKNKDNVEISKSNCIEFDYQKSDYYQLLKLGIEKDIAYDIAYKTYDCESNLILKEQYYNTLIHKGLDEETANDLANIMIQGQYYNYLISKGVKREFAHEMVFKNPEQEKRKVI